MHNVLPSVSCPQTISSTPSSAPEGDDQNFKLDGKEYNYKAEETYEVLKRLEGGVLTRYPLVPIDPEQDDDSDERNDMETVNLGDRAKAVFISYANVDNESDNRKERWLDRLLVQLEPLRQQDELTVCSDTEIPLGTDWHQHIQTHLNGAKAAVLLVSGPFLASEYVRNNELPVLLKNAHDKGVVIIPVLVSPSQFNRVKFKFPHPKDGPEEFLLSSLQTAATPDRTLIEMDEAEQERTLIAVADRLLEIVAHP